ncbi:MAG: oligoendopeptidase F, partial [Hyphomicrobiaceae bacterium]|nr:oligoendopeptidase F [Hyphomicrobiaceae bacterium]
MQHPSPKKDLAMTSATAPDLGQMPEWDLSDLYAAPTAPEVARDIEKGAADAKALKTRWQGKLVAAGSDGAMLAQAVKAYEDLSDLLGKLGSYAGLLYAANQTDPVRAKFYGDISEKLTSISSDLLFFELELNKIDDADLARALQHPDLVRYKPWFDDLRKEKPYQLDEKIEQLFHEKGQTARGSWNRLFNETMSGLRFEVPGIDEPQTLEPTLNLMSDPKPEKRQAGAEALAKVFTGNLRLFTLITNTLAKDKEISDRWRGFKDVAD